VLGYYFVDSFADNIAQTLEQAGKVVHRVETRSRFLQGAMTTPKRSFIDQVLNRSQRVRELLTVGPMTDRLTDLDPELVICTDGFIDPRDVEAMRSATSCAVWAMWFPDAVSNLGNQRMLLAPYDHLFFKDPYLVDLLGRMTNLRAHFLPEACNPLVHLPVSPRNDGERARFSADVAIVGNHYPYRERITECLPQGIQVKLYGNVPRLSAIRESGEPVEYVTGREKALAFGQAKIVLNTLHPGEVRSVNARLFEATACGGFVLSSHSEGIDDLYEIGSEVVTFRSKEEMRSAVLHYVNEAEEREAIASAGQKRAHAQHSYSARLSELMERCIPES
jgi:spore maturation protein CgeB